MTNISPANNKNKKQKKKSNNRIKNNNNNNNINHSPTKFSPIPKDIEKTNSNMSPLSGSEPKYEPWKWNGTHAQFNHNCYAYVLNQIVSQRKGKPQPGYFGQIKYDDVTNYTCPIFYKRLKKDMPSMYLVSFNERCKKGFYKGFIALDPKSGDPDYHFWRQDNNGYWSHKPGRREATDLDASGKKIINPLLADRNYKHFNYKKACFFYCLNQDIVKTSSIL